MKKVLTFLSLLPVVSVSFAQIRVLPNGRVGLGINSPIEKVHVMGGLHLSENGNELRLLPYNTPGTEIGSSTGQIEFWYSFPVGHNTLKAKDYIKMSDRVLEDNINPIKDGLQTVLRLQGVTYNLKSDNGDNPTTEYGFIAQDVENIIKDITQKSSKGYLGLDYDEIIPFLVEAIKEQQTMINEQQAMIEEMRAAGFGTEKSVPYNNRAETPTSQSDMPRLFQNNPNPYKENTQIAYYLPENTVSASLMLFDLQGTLISTHALPGKGQGTFLLNAGSLKAGMYHYTLVANGEAVDTKKMILTQ